jgi:hypothetical protein
MTLSRRRPWKGVSSSERERQLERKRLAKRIPMCRVTTVGTSNGAYQRGRGFLLAHGLTRTPPGCQIGHTVPLAKGGADVPANMQLLCGEGLREKEATELR